MAYIAAILARAGHDVKWTRGEVVDGDVALVLSSLVDYKAETAWADAMRARGREGRLHRHHGVEDAGALRRPLRLHLQRRARSRRHAARAGHRAERHHGERADQRPRLAAVPALGSGHRGSQAEVRVPSSRRGRSAAAIRCWPAAAARSSAPTARTGSSRAIARARSRTSWTRSSGCAIRCRGRT